MIDERIAIRPFDLPSTGDPFVPAGNHEELGIYFNRARPLLGEVETFEGREPVFFRAVNEGTSAPDEFAHPNGALFVVPREVLSGGDVELFRTILRVVPRIGLRIAVDPSPCVMRSEDGVCRPIRVANREEVAQFLGDFVGIGEDQRLALPEEEDGTVFFMGIELVPDFLYRRGRVCASHKDDLRGGLAVCERLQNHVAERKIRVFVRDRVRRVKDKRVDARVRDQSNMPLQDVGIARRVIPKERLAPVMHLGVGADERVVLFRPRIDLLDFRDVVGAVFALGKVTVARNIAVEP